MARGSRAGALAGLGALTLAALASAAERPRLAVVVVVDQLSMGQVERAEDLFGEGGFRRLLRDGAVARDARYLAAPTITAHGHASLATGAYAARHGIVGNDWWERGAGMVSVGHDPRYKLVTRDDLAERDGTAPTQLRAPTFADALRASHPGAKVVSMSLKDRGAILFGGARPTAALWYDKKTDRWTTSTYYAPDVPAWVPKDPVSGGISAWNRLAEPRMCAVLGLPKEHPETCAEKLYARRAGPDELEEERGAAGFGPTFPHALAPAGDAHRTFQFFTTPLADEALFDLAIRAIDAEKLGADEVPDLLFVSASAFDATGHDFGPDSQESFDALLREDRSIARLLAALDEKVGRGKYVFALAADHGSRPAPLKAKREGQYAGKFDPEAFIAASEKALDETLGPRDWLSPLVNTGFSYREGALAGIDRARADAIVLDVARRQEGLQEVYPRSLFLSYQALRGEAAMYARSYFDGRSPDFIVQVRPLWTWEDVASHGSPYISDQRIPFVLYRSGRAGMAIDGIVDAISLTPTLASILGAFPPVGAEGAVLTNVADALR